MENKIICVLRWLAVLPSAIIGALVGTLLASLAYKAAENYVGESVILTVAWVALSVFDFYSNGFCWDAWKTAIAGVFSIGGGFVACGKIDEDYE